MEPSEELVTSLLKWTEVLMHRSMHNFMLYAKEHGLSMPQIGTLFRIQHKGISGVTDIGSELGVTSAAASQMLDRLVQQGLVARSEDPNDRRGKQIILTDKGNEVVQESIRARQGWMNSLAGRLTPAERERVATALNLLIERANQIEDDPACKSAHPPLE
jgi:DNA-binding MarR family transcriptional regulator